MEKFSANGSFFELFAENEKAGMDGKMDVRSAAKEKAFALKMKMHSADGGVHQSISKVMQNSQ